MTIKNTAYKTMMAVGLVLAAYSCANRAQGPTGGPKDVTPPKVVRSLPGNGALNYNKKLIQIDFDEQVSIEKANENVIVSPPQMKPPEVKSFGKRVTMVFNQDLMDSTTYTINFGNGIVDLNEKNPLKNYIFSFATGNEIDTLKVSGTLLNAEDLNPVSGIIVGVYRESDKSAFFEKPFLRIGKTDENGHFSIENMKPGTYKVYALGDLNQDYFFQAGEGAAILDSLVHPTFRIEEMKDTVWQDSTTIDSVRTYMGTRFLPDDLVLRYFKENKKRQYLAKSERKEPFVVNLFFNTQTTELPKIKPLNFDWEGKYLLQKNSTMDSLTYWITDSLVWKTDTLEMAVTYLKSDSLMKLVPTTDTLNLYSRKPRVNPKARASKTTVPKAEPFKLSTNIAGTFEIYNPVVIHFETPVADMDLSKVQLSQRVDTVLKPLTYKWRQLDSTKMSYAL
ncbi:MAG TPA: Ig-like domain-containing domain, partial [Paludibacter sp.]|nr:Ig-like domain-containing domain [Paludibacter sp.]